MEPCWAAAPPPPDPESRPARAPGPVPVDWVDGLVAPAPRTFVPVEPSVPVAVPASAGAGSAVLVAEAVEVVGHPVEVIAEPRTEGPPEPASALARESPRPVPGRWWLWGDPDPWPEP